MAKTDIADAVTAELQRIRPQVRAPKKKLAEPRPWMPDLHDWPDEGVGNQIGIQHAHNLPPTK